MRVPPFRRLLAAALAGICVFLMQAASSNQERLLGAYDALKRGKTGAALEIARSLPAASPERAYMEFRVALERLSSGDPGLAEETYAGTPSEYARESLGKLLSSHYAREGDALNYERIRSDFSGDFGPGLACADAIFAKPSEQELRDLWYAVDPGEYKVCEHLFRQAARSGALAQDDIWRKLRLYAGKRKYKSARKVLLLLPKNSRPTIGQLSNAIHKASRRIRAKHNLDTRGRQEMVAVSAMVASRANPSLAEQRWGKFARYFPRSTNDDVWLSIAVWSAKFHRKQALGLFRKVGLDLYDDEARAWRVRAGLRASDWEDILLVIDAMPPEQAEVTAWQYWRAHALGALGKKEEGSRALEALAESADDFYGLLAREMLGQDLVRQGEAPSVVRQGMDLADVDFDLGFAQAADWVGNPWQGLKIWRATLPRLSAEGRYQAAVLAERQKWYLASTVASDMVPQSINSLATRFPTPYLDLAREYSRELDLDLAFVYGLMRQESRFMPNAVSYANAQGLMQILPATAKKVARKNKFTKYRKSRLKRPETNIIIGTHYLEELRDSLGDDPILIAAGYNAGPGRPKRWKTRSDNVDKLVYIENIPITQTRLYVKHLLANAAHYDHVFSLRAPSILGRASGSY